MNSDPLRQSKRIKFQKTLATTCIISINKVLRLNISIQTDLIERRLNMKLHIYIDSSDIEPSRLDDIYTPISEEITNWIGDKQTVRSLSDTTDADEHLAQRKLGISIELKSKHKLKDPLNFLYTLAKTYQCEFAIAIVDPDSNELEDVCYFGFEEGRPDLFEVANYLAL